MRLFTALTFVLMTLGSASAYAQTECDWQYVSETQENYVCEVTEEWSATGDAAFITLASITGVATGALLTSIVARNTYSVAELKDPKAAKRYDTWGTVQNVSLIVGLLALGSTIGYAMSQSGTTETRRETRDTRMRTPSMNFSFNF